MDDAARPVKDWEVELGRRLLLFGHRNWIVVADAAYPAQSNPGIETIVAGGNHVDAVLKVMVSIAARKHIRANVYTDLELGFFPEADAPGVTDYRESLNSLLKDAGRRAISHEEIITKLDECARLFRVLIIKTDLTIPYTSVFFELDCGYWDAVAEKSLRSAMNSANT